MEEDTLTHFTSLHASKAKAHLVARSGLIFERIAADPEPHVPTNASCTDLAIAHPEVSSYHGSNRNVISDSSQIPLVSEATSESSSQTFSEGPKTTNTNTNVMHENTHSRVASHLDVDALATSQHGYNTAGTMEKESEQGQEDMSRLVQQRLHQLSQENIHLQAELAILRTREKELLDECNSFRRQLSEASSGALQASLPFWRSQVRRDNIRQKRC